MAGAKGGGTEAQEGVWLTVDAKGREGGGRPLLLFLFLFLLLVWGGWGDGPNAP